MRSLALLSLPLVALAGTAFSQGVQVKTNEAERRVDITVDGKPFTAYVWPESLMKPVLYPLVDGEGITVTRGYPLDPRPDERVDHPHHAGVWFNYGNVNGFDFWNNSTAIKPEDKPKYGSIRFDKIVSAKSGKDRGELTVDSIWRTGTGQDILRERTHYIFLNRDGARIIDQIITLEAIDTAVFNDDKEGLLGMRVASWLESPEEKGGVFMDANGKPTQVAAVPNSTATGVYETSAGVKGPAVWSTRGRWCTLTGHTGDHQAVVAILDHPQNPDYPTYWHARGYGLFAANPLGRSIFEPKQPPLNYTLAKGQKTTFRYRILLLSHPATPTRMNHEADAFAAEYK